MTQQLPPATVAGQPTALAAHGSPTPPAGKRGRAREASPEPPTLKGRRRPLMIAAGIALVVVGALTAATVVTRLGDTIQVLAMAQTVERGDVIEENDLVTVQIARDPNLRTVSGSGNARDELVGQVAAADLPEGALVTPDSIVDTLTPPEKGQTIVGLTLVPAQLPAQELIAGDSVRIVDTPREGDPPPAKDPSFITAIVSQSRPTGDQGEVTVDVIVPIDDAPGLAARAATHRIALVLDHTGTGGK